jgi:hypothetical protein
MRNVLVQVGDNAPNHGNIGNLGNAICKASAAKYSFAGPGSNGQVIEVVCDTPLVGRYLSIALDAPGEALTICEAQIFAYSVGKKLQLPAGKAYHSSECCGGNPNRAIDGNTYKMWWGNTCTHTDQQSRPWWASPLGSTQMVTQIIIHNREDCCGDRLRNVVVKVGMSEPNGSNINNGNYNTVCKATTEKYSFAGPASNGQVVKVVCAAPIKSQFISIMLDHDSIREYSSIYACFKSLFLLFSYYFLALRPMIGLK